MNTISNNPNSTIDNCSSLDRCKQSPPAFLDLTDSVSFSFAQKVEWLLTSDYHRQQGWELNMKHICHAFPTFPSIIPTYTSFHDFTACGAQATWAWAATSYSVQNVQGWNACTWATAGSGAGQHPARPQWNILQHLATSAPTTTPWFNVVLNKEHPAGVRFSAYQAPMDADI